MATGWRFGEGWGEERGLDARRISGADLEGGALRAEVVQCVRTRSDDLGVAQVDPLLEALGAGVAVGDDGDEGFDDLRDLARDPAGLRKREHLHLIAELDAGLGAPLPHCIDEARCRRCTTFRIGSCGVDEAVDVWASDLHRVKGGRRQATKARGLPKLLEA
jgi:hypothetical protein